MSDPDDYESLPASASLSVTCLAGALAGVAEHCVMFPIDSVKVGAEGERVVHLSCMTGDSESMRDSDSNRHITHL